VRLAISNIAWETTEDEQVAKLLQDFLIDAIDIAPSKYFPEPAKATKTDIVRVKNWWINRGIEITGMQALLFGTTGLNVFGTKASQQLMLQHLSEVCRIAAGLGATRLVFGSPKNRDCTGLNYQETMSIAVDFFSQIGDIAQSYGVLICLEPNPSCYGANFMLNSMDTAQIVQAINHPAIRMQFDMGAVTINNEEPNQVLKNYSHLVGHIHASEPNLLPLGDGTTNHAKISQALAQYLPEHIVSIEMLSNKDEHCLRSIKRALLVAVQHYQNKQTI